MTPAPPDRAVSTKAVRRGFRDDIQGMRALAVLGILVFHAGIAPYPGGFVTLDVFFVLSGFLITTLLLREVAKTGTIDLVGFYVRRARRILPAATVAIIGTVVASWLWLNPLDARDASVDGVWAALFGANIRFAVEETDYFTATDPPSPLQHFWSLSVEEQFYLVMPLALLASIVVAALVLRRGDGRAHRAGIVTVLALATAASLAWSVHASTASPESAYFSTFTRVWEFAAGGLLAVFAPRLARGLGHVARNVVAVGGLGLIGVAMFVVTEESAFPGWLALLPVLGTSAVILAGTGLDDVAVAARPARPRRAAHAGRRRRLLLPLPVALAGARRRRAARRSRPAARRAAGGARRDRGDDVGVVPPRRDAVPHGAYGEAPPRDDALPGCRVARRGVLPGRHQPHRPPAGGAGRPDLGRRLRADRRRLPDLEGPVDRPRAGVRAGRGRRAADPPRHPTGAARPEGRPRRPRRLRVHRDPRDPVPLRGPRRRPDHGGARQLPRPALDPGLRPDRGAGGLAHLLPGEVPVHPGARADGARRRDGSSRGRAASTSTRGRRTGSASSTPSSSSCRRRVRPTSRWTARWSAAPTVSSRSWARASTGSSPTCSR